MYIYVYIVLFKLSSACMLWTLYLIKVFSVFRNIPLLIVVACVVLILCALSAVRACGRAASV